ncbi:MAG: hypothetical protein QHJ34_14060 [bacterium]|jgi:hypothetical protein|nr:hypothetical protein [candidate division KSB1 bacterium]MDH7561335.1 hypothetical protein [bacterium]
MNLCAKLWQLWLLALSAFCVVTLLRFGPGESLQAADDNCFRYDLCYKFGLINCIPINGCPEIGFRCVVRGNECSYHPGWCPDCLQQ